MSVSPIISAYAEQKYIERIFKAAHNYGELTMSQLRQDEQWFELFDFVRDTFLDLSAKNKKQDLDHVDAHLLAKSASLLDRVTTDGTGLSEECERRFQYGAKIHNWLHFQEGA